jgi:hypothetical protein
MGVATLGVPKIWVTASGEGIFFNKRVEDQWGDVEVFGRLSRLKKM